MRVAQALVLALQSLQDPALRGVQMRVRDPKVRELMEEAASSSSDSGALEAARQHLLRQLDVYR